ncbi:MAG: hypothetical protein QXT38_03640 [Candidatus Aenigmatarchaeota archaeon]
MRKKDFLKNLFFILFFVFGSSENLISEISIVFEKVPISKGIKFWIGPSQGKEKLVNYAGKIGIETDVLKEQVLFTAI